jgi:hypothetical protein
MVDDSVWAIIKQGPDANIAQWVESVADALVDLQEQVDEEVYKSWRHRTGV